MMNASTLLAVFAQVSIGFLGFTGLVSVLSPREWDSPLIGLRFWILIEFSFGGLLLALAPLVLFQWGWEEAVTWRVLSGAFLVLFVLHGAVFFPRIARLAKAGDWPGVPRAVNAPMIGGLVLCVMSQLLTIAGLIPAAGGFQLGLLLLTFLTGWNFATMLMVLRNERNRNTGSSG